MEEKVFITLDIDWACDEVLLNSIDIIEKANVEATWFVTHDTPLLGRLRENPRFELGIHPNFNFLLSGDPGNGGTAQEIVDRLLAIVPEAKSVRSHSLTHGTRLIELFRSRNLSHDCNIFVPYTANIEIKPWKLWNGMIQVPYIWADEFADNVPITSSIQIIEKRRGFRVLDFHPIHIFLNTENLDRYENSRSYHHYPKLLLKHRNPGQGTRTVLSTLLARSG